MQQFEDCDIPTFSISPLERVHERVSEAQSGGHPLSLIRLGDGEGLAMSLGDDSWLEDINIMASHFGMTTVSYRALLKLRDELRQAFSRADIVGIRGDVLGARIEPELFRAPPHELAKVVKERFALRASEVNIPARGCRRLALVNKVLCETAFQSKAMFASAWVNWDIAVSGVLYDLMNRQQKIGIITSRCSLPSLVGAFWDIPVSGYLVPDKFAAGGLAAGAHFPSRFEQLRQDLNVEFPGMLFLVGAGLCGKVYCHWIRERGGIALDIGAVMDAWIGLGTRPLVLADRFAHSPKWGGVPQELLLNPGNIDRALANLNGDE